MTLKLFKVDVESFVYVLAQDKKKAEDFVRDCRSGISSGDIMDGAWCSASEVKNLEDIDADFIDSIPFVSVREEDYQIVEDLTCKKIMELFQEEQEKIRVKSQMDRSQLKLPLEGVKTEPDLIVCKSCGYLGVIESFEMSFSVYNDVKCPKCGSTNCDHNSNYQKELFAAIKKTLDKPSE